MKPKFKLGPCKTRDGKEAFIFEINEKTIFGKATIYSRWESEHWDCNGAYANGGISMQDLIPNNEPESVEFETTVRSERCGSSKSYQCIWFDPMPHSYFERFINKRAIVKVTVIE